MQLTLTRLSCPSCGAPLSFRPGMVAVRCPFCDTETLLGGRDDLAEVSVETRQVAPFSTTPEAFQQALLAWLSEGDFTPDDILEQALLTEHTGLFLPVWRLSGELHADFTVSAGYDREVEKIIERRQDDGSVRRDVRHETVTDWRPFRGEATAPYAVWVLGSGSVPEALQGWAEDVAEACEAWQELTPELLGGHLVEEFGVDADAALAGRGAKGVQRTAEARCKERVPGDRTKDLKVDVRTRDERAEPHLHPFWFAAFEYGDRTYPVGMSGRDLSKATGERPVDADRKARVTALARPWKISLAVTLVVTVIGLCAGVFPGIIALVVGGITTGGFVWSAHKKTQVILEASRAVRRRVLERVQSGGQ